VIGRPARQRAVAVALAAVLASGALVGCSSDDDAGEPVPTAGTLVRPGTGDSCADPTGDLDLPAGISADSPGLSGIDIVEASATVAGDDLAISFTMAGPVDEAPAATYVVAQGEALGALSFELRLVHGDDGWTTTLVTWPGGKEDRQRLAVTPMASGATLTAAVPVATLPPVAQAMQFGATARVGDQLVVDDCSSLDGR
jgi:hypothetical protein